MSSYINTNTTASEAAYNLGINQSNEQKNIQRLSSGLRINSAADDASGLVISESLRAQSAGLTQATAKHHDAINVVKTAEGALNEVHSLLINIRSLVVHAANVGANDPTALKADQDAIASAVSSINRIASTTQFNNKNPAGRLGLLVFGVRHRRHRHGQQHRFHQPGSRLAGCLLRHHGHRQRPCRLHRSDRQRGKGCVHGRFGR